MPKHTPPVTFETWLRSALVGERLTYHLEPRGGAALGGDELGRIVPDAQLWRSAWQASQEGKVALFQVRGDRYVEYIAERISVKGARFLRRAFRLNGPTPTKAQIAAVKRRVRQEIAA